MILLWGLRRDSPLAAVQAALEQRNARVAFVDQRAVLRSEVELSVGSSVEGSLRCRDLSIDLGAVTAAYLRPYDSRRLPDVARAGPNGPEWTHALNFADILWSWAEITPALVVNRPSAMAQNGSKPHQSEQIRSFGFEVPETLVTTDPQAVRDFWAHHGSIVYKSISGVRSIVARLGPQHADRIDDVVWCPTQFQHYVCGTDYRVHVIGEELFCHQVTSEADDYRYASRQGVSVNMRPSALPPEWANRCRSLTAAMGLAVAGIDLRRTPEGAWYCFEVNPSPAFTYFDDAADQPIARAVARLLCATTA
jgi:hypothetical protein